jgi:anthranilate phosphoribosyltransferase
MIKEAIGTLAKGQALTRNEAALVMEEIMEGQASPAQLGAFLTALSIKGETSDEIAGWPQSCEKRPSRSKLKGHCWIS